MKQRVRLWALAGILLFTFGLRVFRLGAQSLWYDETVSIYLAGQSVPDLIAHTAGDIHPPGYYLALHVWTRLAGRSEFSSAFLSLWFGAVLVVLAYRLGARVFGHAAGLCGALLVSFSPFNLWYSQEVRMYTLGAALGMGVLWCVVELIFGPGDGGARRRTLVGYGVLAALGLWVLYYFAFLLVGLNTLVVVWWLVAWRRRRVGLGWLAGWLGAQALALLLYAPWVPVAWRQVTSPPVPAWRSLTPLSKVIMDSWSALSLGQSADPAKVWPALVLTLFLVGLGLASNRIPKRAGPRGAEGRPSRTSAFQEGTGDGGWLVAGYVAVPVLLIWLASFISPLYHVRYVFTYSTPFYVLVGAGVAWLWRCWRPAAWAGLILLFAFCAASVWTYHTDVHLAADDHRAATHFLQELWRPGDAILVDAGYVYTAVYTYWEGEPPAWSGRLVSEGGLGYGDLAQSRPVVLLAGTVGGDKQLGWNDPGSDFYAMTVQDAEAALEQVFSDFSRVWVYRCYDTVTDPNGEIRRWLTEHGKQFEDRVFTGESQLRVQGYVTSRDPLAGTVAAGNALADGSLVLRAWTTPTSSVPVGGDIDLALVWHVGQMPQDGRILFAGLYDADGQRWAQTDVRSLGSLYPVEAWSEGSTVRTPLRVPVSPGMPPGSYRLEIGWYRFVDGQPIWIPWGVGNLLPAGHIEVVAPSDWWALPLPPVRERQEMSFGQGLLLKGMNGGPWSVAPGETVQAELVWQGGRSGVEPATTVLVLTDDAGRFIAQSSGGKEPVTLNPGQAVRAAESLVVPSALQAGMYSLAVGRRRDDGSWLAIRRGAFSLGATVPLGTVRVVAYSAQSGGSGQNK